MGQTKSQRKRRASKTPKKFSSRSKVTSFTRRGSGDFGKESDDMSQRCLIEAAEVIAVQARVNASKFSTRIGPATVVVPGDTVEEVIVITDGDKAPNGLPFEFGERHPLNWPNQVAAAAGDKRPSGKTPRRPYLSKAVRSKSELALEVYAKSMDEIAARDGWDE